MTNGSTAWLVVGFVGQAIFMARFLVQLAASEKQRNSVVPVSFWWISLIGGGVLFAYAAHNRDPVILVGQSMGIFVYTRNLMLVSEARRTAAPPNLAVVVADSESSDCSEGAVQRAA